MVAAVAGVALVVVVLRLSPGRLRPGSHAPSRDLRGSVLSPRAWPGIVLASTVAVMGHIAVFVVAVDGDRTDLDWVELVPLALVVLVAWAYRRTWPGGAGARARPRGRSARSGCAAEGVTVAVVYGVLVLVATLPGAVMLVAGRGRRRDGACERTGAQAERVRGVVDA